MPPKRSKPSGTAKAGLCVIAPLGSDAAAELARIAAAAKACPGASWILVDRGEGLAARLAQAPELARLKATAVAAPQESGDWGAYCAAAAQAGAKTCLLLPQASLLNASTLAALKKAQAGAEIAYSSRLAAHPWAFKALATFWKLPGLDFGSPALITRARLLSLAQGKNPASYFLGPRLAKEAILAGASLRQLALPGAGGPVDGFSVLGEGAAGAELSRKIIGYAGGFALIFISFAFVLRQSNFIGLSLIAAGFFMAAGAFGREK